MYSLAHDGLGAAQLRRDRRIGELVEHARPNRLSLSSRQLVEQLCQLRLVCERRELVDACEILVVEGHRLEPEAASRRRFHASSTQAVVELVLGYAEQPAGRRPALRVELTTCSDDRRERLGGEVERDLEVACATQVKAHDRWQPAAIEAFEGLLAARRRLGQQRVVVLRSRPHVSTSLERRFCDRSAGQAGGADTLRVMSRKGATTDAGPLLALLRGINVGGVQIAMADLRELMQGLGYENVRTHLRSGNVIFEANREAPDKAASRIEDAIGEQLKLKVPVLVRTAAELAAVVELNPLAAHVDNESRYVVMFLSKPIDPKALAELDEASYAPDRYAAGEREVYVWAPNGVSETKLSWSFWERRLGVTATGRNWKTVTRLLAMAQE